MVVWIDGEFGEFTLRKNRNSTSILDERSFHVGIDRLSDGGGLWFALGLGEAKPINRNRESHLESRNYSLSTYGRFEDGSDATYFGISTRTFIPIDWMEKSFLKVKERLVRYMDPLRSFVLSAVSLTIGKFLLILELMPPTQSLMNLVK